jgi:hypothetical protein
MEYFTKTGHSSSKLKGPNIPTSPPARARVLGSSRKERRQFFDGAEEEKREKKREKKKEKRRKKGKKEKNKGDENIRRELGKMH